MKKFIALLSIIILALTFTVSKVSANDIASSTEERIVVSVLAKSVDRKTIDELELNEMQYIKLRSLSKQYQKDLSTLSNASFSNDPTEENLQQLNTRYFTALNTVLTEKQMSVFILQNTVANVK